ncbi:hypothetical protein LSUB1_G003619 [Lachnellula subtilissima]|uniref:Acyltransferase 3 domain-containing protein n=1 Tax=Lachnellula subtilissima TaxID=602034 RepID=A0A8H8RPD4_9HELO|nr:hypothetical protein LSUB1_G003619 [Lachnellula subtilissima]
MLPVSKDQITGGAASLSRCSDVDSSASPEVEIKDSPTSRPWLIFQLPTWSGSFTSSGPPSEELARSSRRLHSTAWLDGLRGIAALLVVFHHATWLWYPNLSEGWGSSPDNYRFIQLPIIRIIYAAGTAMVAIFFTVSGFSLSYKPLSLIRTGRSSELLGSLSSSGFRRQLRLVLPPAATTFVSMLVTHAGWYGTGKNSRQPIRHDSLAANVFLWMRSVVELADPFRPVVYPGGHNPTYDANLWTIPVEIHGSMVIFVTLLGILKLHASLRIAVLVSIFMFLFVNAYTHLFLFLKRRTSSRLASHARGTNKQGTNPSFATARLCRFGASVNTTTQTRAAMLKRDEVILDPQLPARNVRVLYALAYSRLREISRVHDSVLLDPRPLPEPY